MGMGSLKMWRLGMLNTEFPRYEYQKKRWKKAGKNNTMLAMQIEGILQGLANASFLAMPAFIIATNSNATISILEIVGVVVWLGAFVMESIADMQKISFLKKMKVLGEKNKVCNVGLWKYTRHPNYFAEWMVWNGLIIASIPSWILLYNTESIDYMDITRIRTTIYLKNDVYNISVSYRRYSIRILFFKKTP